MTATQRVVATTTVMLFLGLPSARAGTSVAVFNFQMKSDTPQWVWLQKGLADQLTTHLAADRKLMVVARDEMQAVARKVRWTPELLRTDPDRAEEIRKALKIDYLMTGVFAVQGDRITLTAQIVEMETRKELARKEVSGPVKDVLELQRRLAAELLGWFWKKPAEKMLQTLPVWTRSTPAVRAMYEGIDLYDQGRYGEAWLKFRQAAGRDAAYLEAQYWVGRMYYFMDRYRHARRAFERFVYMGRYHPRMGDAIKEYLHTYEKLDTPPEELLRLYADFQQRFSDVVMYSPHDRVPLTASPWLRVRSAQVLQQMGRFPEAVRLASGVMDEYYRTSGRRWWTPGVWTGWSSRIALSSAQSHNQLTGEVLMPKGIVDRMTNLIRFAPDRTEVTVKHRYGFFVRQSARSGRTHYGGRHATYTLLAPDGYALKKLTLYPDITGEDGKIGCWLNQYSHLDIPAEADKPVALAREEGLVIRDIPRAGIFYLVFYMYANDAWRNPRISYRGCRAVAELEKIGPHGSIRVSCPNASSFYMVVDGRAARKRPGLIGLLPPGRHKLQFRYSRWGSVHPPHEVDVDVQEGKTSRVSVTLPWKKDGPLVGWTSGTLINQGYPHRGPCLQSTQDAPAIQADDKAIRVFWSHRGDIWRAVSTDGNTYSPPDRLPMPVSSGWIEQSPVCLRDESGRFVLAFLSDRGAQHRMRAYICWSRDAVHWSRPAAIDDRSINKYHLIQDDQGRFIWADATSSKVTVMTSRDGYRWEKAAQLPLPGEERAVWIMQRPEGPGEERAVWIMQRPDGTYELFVAAIELRRKDPSPRHRVAYRYRSADLVQWSSPEVIRDFRGKGELSMSAMHVAGRTHVAFFENDMYAGYWPFVAWAREAGTAQWERAKESFPGVGSYYGVAAHHPRWGYMVCWRHPEEVGASLDEGGPYLIRGRSVERLFRSAKPAAESQPQK